MSAPEQFDPYRDWLGIAPQEQPADHYRLLGLARFESDLMRIAAAADERMAQVRKFQLGPRGRFTQTLLNELAAAKVCLLSPEEKSAYDAELARAMSMTIGPRRPPPIPPPLAAPLSQPLAVTIAGTPAAPQPVEAMPWYGIVLAITAVTLLLLIGGLLWRFEQMKRQRVVVAASKLAAAQAADVQKETGQEKEPAAVPVLQVQEGNGEVFLDSATGATAGGVELLATGTGQVLTNWTSAEAAAHWQFRLIIAGNFTVEIQYASASDSVATELEVSIDDQSQGVDVRGTGGLTRVRTHTFPVEIATPGEHTLTIRSKQPLPAQWFELHAIRIIPVSRPQEPPLLTE